MKVRELVKIIENNPQMLDQEVKVQIATSARVHQAHSRVPVEKVEAVLDREYLDFVLFVTL